METIELLKKFGIITPEQMEKADEEVKRTGISLEKALKKLGFINEEDITKLKADSLGVPYMDLNEYLINTEIVKLIPENIARKFKLVPLFKMSNTLTIAITNPNDIEALDQIRKLTGTDTLEIVMASEIGITKVLNSCYETQDPVNDILKSIEPKTTHPQQEDLEQIIEDQPIIKLVNIIITEAVKDRASDIHIEPQQANVSVRYRVDGVLYEARSLPKKLQGLVISRIKILANMDIAENRIPQDGKINIKLENNELDIRVSTFPTIYGENVVMRLFDKNAILLELKELGFNAQNFQIFEKLIRHSHGIILVTGPTGSGKTTTLYAALANISSMEKNIITIEDPVEYVLPLIRQTQINLKAGLSFANGLRSILRQDPDVIMVGEIRDRETAEIAIQASLTGHLVFSTLHTNNAASTLTRLMDMQVEPFLISSSCLAILAQRLIRTICAKCKEKYIPQDEILNELGINERVEFFKGKGCDNCKNSGFKGRIGIFELLTVNEEIRKMINTKNSADEINRKAIEQGMITLRQDGLEKAKLGLTTVEEVLRITKVDK